MQRGYYVSEAPRPVGGGVPQNDAVLPRYRSVGGCGCGGAEGDQYRTMTAGHVAFAAAAGILGGMTFMWIWKERTAAG